MDQAGYDAYNRALLERFLKRVDKDELVVAVVTVKTDSKGLGWYPVLAKESGMILDMLRQKPDEVTVNLDS